MRMADYFYATKTMGVFSRRITPETGPNIFGRPPNALRLAKSGVNYDIRK